MEGFRADIDMSNDMPPPYSGERIDSFSSMSQASQAHSDSISFWHEQANQDHLMSQVPMDGFDQHQYGNIPALTPQAPLLSTYGQNPFSNSTSSLDAGCAVTGGAMALPFRLRDQASFGPQMAMQTSYGKFVFLHHLVFALHRNREGEEGSRSRNRRSMRRPPTCGRPCVCA